MIELLISIAAAAVVVGLVVLFILAVDFAETVEPQCGPCFHSFGVVVAAVEARDGIPMCRRCLEMPVID